MNWISIGWGNGLSPIRCQAINLNQWLLIVNWTLRNKLQWNSNQNTKLFIYENAFENGVCEMAAILREELKVNYSCVQRVITAVSRLYSGLSVVRRLPFQILFCSDSVHIYVTHDKEHDSCVFHFAILANLRSEEDVMGKTRDFRFN